jgi:hypothetical protein
MMTYGEYWIAIKMSMQMVDGKWTVYKPLQNMPRQMNRKEASKYYNKKLNNYWQSQELRA